VEQGPFSKKVVQEYQAELQRRGLSPSSINVQLAALRKLASEAADNGLLSPHIAAEIAKVGGVRYVGGRLGPV
jgi:site-specific recombinase XerD